MLKFLNKIDKDLGLPATTPEQLKKVMAQFDINNDGVLTLEEIYPIFIYSIGLLAGLSKREIKRLLDEWEKAR